MFSNFSKRGIEYAEFKEETKFETDQLIKRIAIGI